MDTPVIDQVLGEVIRQGGAVSAADTLLDIREAVLRKQSAGDCLGCYFKILSHHRKMSESSLAPLRAWMEANMEIIAHGPDGSELERTPLSLEGESLEDFCARTSDVFREDRDYTVPRIEICVGFREQIQVA